LCRQDQSAATAAGGSARSALSARGDDAGCRRGKETGRGGGGENLRERRPRLRESREPDRRLSARDELPKGACSARRLRVQADGVILPGPKFSMSFRGAKAMRKLLFDCGIGDACDKQVPRRYASLHSSE